MKRPLIDLNGDAGCALVIIICATIIIVTGHRS